MKNTVNPIQSVKKPGVINSKPDTNRNIPPLISSVGITPCDKLFWALKRRLIPLLLTKKIPINAVNRIIPIVFNIPILLPIVINILISISSNILLI